MRSRSKSSTRQHIAEHGWEGGGAIWGPTPFDVVHSQETMVDSTERLGHDVFPMKPVTHRKYDYKPQWNRYTNAGRPGICNSFYHQPLWPWLVPDVDSVFSSFSKIDDHMSRYKGILETVLPSLEPSFDLVVVIGEILELVSLARSFRKLVKKLSDIPKTLGEAKRMIQRFSKSENKMLSIADTLSGDFLWYNFALKPALNDAYNLLEGFLTLGDRLHALRVGAGLDKIHKAHGGFRDNLPVGETWMEEVVACGGNCSRSKTGYYRLTDSYHVVKGGLTVVYSYELPHEFDKLWSSYGSALQTLGGSVSLKSGWDLIPFSFVVDWVLPIGEMLGEYKLEAYPVNVVIHQICLSLRSRRRGLVRNNGFCYTDDSEVITGSLYAEEYTREVFQSLPCDISAELPSFYQFLLGAALAVQRGKNPYQGWSSLLEHARKTRNG